MPKRVELSWDILCELPVVRAIARIVRRRWRLELGYTSAASPTAQPPRPPCSGVCRIIQKPEAGLRACRNTAYDAWQQLAAVPTEGTGSTRPTLLTCHAGLRELITPVVVRGHKVGALLCGGFWVTPTGPGHQGEDDIARQSAWATMDERTRALDLAVDKYRAAQTQQPWLTMEAIELVNELLEAAAESIAGYAEGHLDGAAEAANRKRGTRSRYGAIIGESAPMQALYSILDRVVQSDSTVLIQGANGTGKELVARAVHENSARQLRRFVITNCSAFNDNLLDSELFGHKRGAFTGAVADKQGLFEVADQGTFFLDEIGDMSPTLQVKVLRVLQEGTFIPVGDTEARHVDVRIIAATNRDLKAMVESGDFREDLYYRINVINLHIPPLRDRRGDIELLAAHFLHQHGRARSTHKKLSQGCMKHFMHYSWPGNVRELENEIERLIVLAGDADIIDETLLSPRILTPASTDLVPSNHSLPAAMRTLERRMISESLRRHNWNKTRASAELEISRRNLIRLVKKYDLDAERGR